MMCPRDMDLHWSASLMVFFTGIAIVTASFNEEHYILLRSVRAANRTYDLTNQTNSDDYVSELGRNTTKILDSLLDGYDKSLRPGFGGPPLTVNINIFVRSMGPISEKDMVYSMDCYFRQRWVDKRLGFDGPKSLNTLTINNIMLDKIWRPDTYFYNGKASYLHTITTPNKFLRISRDGSIYYSMRLTIKASCPMQLQKYPMDKQICPLKVGSYGYSDSDVEYFWMGDAVGREADLQMSQFQLVATPSYSITEQFPNRGNFSFLVVNFELRRHMGYFLINVYIPVMMLVIISWVGFWINREATADRIALGVTTVLTMAFLSIDTRTDLPRVSYSTALDWFIGMCFSFVLATIIQFATVHFFTKHGTGEVMNVAPDSDDELEPESQQETPLLKRRGDKRSTVCYTVGRRQLPETITEERCSNGDVENSKTNGVHFSEGIDVEENKNEGDKKRKSCWTYLMYCLKGSGAYKKFTQISTQATAPGSF
ncbi:gamma-aminobutyric acid receptor alpha-like [Lingula anatina]|uniref:Gamma-aminobutyric acid receptor alpha-like n=1 Tax=Lingula anatina TaxID=7574 RepID=A0A2R2MQT1_LINAN|nr:gamma-aminobutyric acid receptor alpha-like [Lingula anatina]|eukprot:XP_023932518.1 gamma-aminobutyric acid receptor alpha-like [Lingula anatina]